MCVCGGGGRGGGTGRACTQKSNQKSKQQYGDCEEALFASAIDCFAVEFQVVEAILK